jgi:hypothetical protein
MRTDVPAIIAEASSEGWQQMVCAAHPTGICGYGQRNACGRLNRSALGVRAGLLTVWHGLASQHLLHHLQHVPQALLLHWRILGHRKDYELSIVP